MRGDDPQQPGVFSFIMPEQRVPRDHPLRPIRAMVDAILHELSPAFARLYSKTGRPSIPPERLLRALLLQVLYTIRSERQLMMSPSSKRWRFLVNVVGSYPERSVSFDS